jgi:hypothetical protein
VTRREVWIVAGLGVLYVLAALAGGWLLAVYG